MPYFKNDDINILYIHIPKTGGTSLDVYFSNKYKISLNDKSLFMFLDKEIQIKNNISIDSSLQHMTYNTIFKYKNFFNINCNNINIITTVRNPYERLVSDLFCYKKININSSKDDIFYIIQSYLTEKLDNHNLPQYKFITDDNKNLIPNIKILHTETLDEDMINLGYIDFKFKLNINENNNINDNVNKLNYYNYLSNNSIQLINDFYDYDFKLFNYNKIVI